MMSLQREIAIIEPRMQATDFINVHCAQLCAKTVIRDKKSQENASHEAERSTDATSEAI